MSQIRTSKKLQADIVEFDRMREDDDRRALKLLTTSIDVFSPENGVGPETTKAVAYERRY